MALSQARWRPLHRVALPDPAKPTAQTGPYAPQSTSVDYRIVLGYGALEGGYWDRPLGCLFAAEEMYADWSFEKLESASVGAPRSLSHDQLPSVAASTTGVFPIWARRGG